MVRKTLLVLLLLLIFIQAGLPLCQAHNSIVVELPIDTNLQNLPFFYKGGLEVVIEALGDFPLPQGAQGRFFRREIKKGEKLIYPSISFDSVGLYSYRIYQDWTGKNSKAYDSRVYLAKIYILNDEEDLTKMLVFYQEDEEDKCGELVFDSGVLGFTGDEPLPISIVDDIHKKEDESEKEKTSLPSTGESSKLFYAASLGFLLSSMLLKKKL